MLKIKRVYEQKGRGDGKRILVDRLWPRGVKKEDAAIDEWLKDIAPSADLRNKFCHRPERFADFRKSYMDELSRPEKAALLKRIAGLAEKGAVTLVYGARDAEHNNAVVLAEVIGDLIKAKPKAG